MGCGGSKDEGASKEEEKDAAAAEIQAAALSYKHKKDAAAEEKKKDAAAAEIQGGAAAYLKKKREEKDALEGRVLDRERAGRRLLGRLSGDGAHAPEGAGAAAPQQPGRARKHGDGGMLI